MGENTVSPCCFLHPCECDRLPGDNHWEAVVVCALQELLELGHGGGVLGQDGQRLVPLWLHHVRRQGDVAELVLQYDCDYKRGQGRSRGNNQN